MANNSAAGSSKSTPTYLQAAASALADYFAKKGHVPTIEQHIPAEEDRQEEVKARAPALKSTTTLDATAIAKNTDEIEDLNAKTGFKATVASDLLAAVSRLNINYQRKLTPSTYVPCSLQMFSRIHIMNESLSKHYAFLSDCPSYHPYIFRLYCGILFWIQCLRVTVHIGLAPPAQVHFLKCFIDVFTPESLPIPGPLLLIFKSLCASQPENPDIGLVSPILRTSGPSKRSSFIPLNNIAFYGMPNIPGIMALLSSLKNSFDSGVYPAYGQHIPVGENATVFGTAPFPADAIRSPRHKWSLVSPGIEYPCEAGSQLHRTFARHIEDFSLPELLPTDATSKLESFLSFNKGFTWFNQVREVAASISSYYPASRTLADCPVLGYNHNQYLIHYKDPDPLPAPTRIADPKSLFPLQFYVETSAREEQIANLHIAASVQTNVVFPGNHPAADAFGHEGATRSGPFWDVWPTSTTHFNEDGETRLRNIVRDAIINKR